VHRAGCDREAFFFPLPGGVCQLPGRRSSSSAGHRLLHSSSDIDFWQVFPLERFIDPAPLAARLDSFDFSPWVISYGL